MYENAPSFSRNSSDPINPTIMAIAEESGEKSDTSICATIRTLMRDVIFEQTVFPAMDISFLGWKIFIELLNSLFSRRQATVNVIAAPIHKITFVKKKNEFSSVTLGDIAKSLRITVLEHNAAVIVVIIKISGINACLLVCCLSLSLQICLF